MGPRALCAMRTVLEAMGSRGGVCGSHREPVRDLGSSFLFSQAEGSREPVGAAQAGSSCRRRSWCLTIPGGSLHPPQTWAWDTGVWDPDPSPFCSCASSATPLAFSVPTVPCAQMRTSSSSTPKWLTEQLNVESDKRRRVAFYHLGLEKGAWPWTVSLRYGSAPQFLCLW